MNALWSLINLLVFIQIVTCRDFYLGMFRRNDFLVAQDVIYKAPAPFGPTTASYGRLFKCPITYFRVVDRLGMGRGPITTIVRGGLRKKFIAVRIKSTHRLPVSVNIYVGCENKKPSTFRTTLTTTTLTHATTKETGGNSTSDDVSDTTDGSEATTTDGSDSVTGGDNSSTIPDNDNNTASTGPRDDPDDGDATASTGSGDDPNDGDATASTGPGDDPGNDDNTAATEPENADDAPATTTEEPPA